MPARALTDNDNRILPSRTRNRSVLYGVFQKEQKARRGAGIKFVHQDRAAPQQVAMAFEREVDRRV
jgi:hypothetical protein